jgi:hypothetical protein
LHQTARRFIYLFIFNKPDVENLTLLERGSGSLLESTKAYTGGNQPQRSEEHSMTHAHRRASTLVAALELRVLTGFGEMKEIINVTETVKRKTRSWGTFLFLEIENKKCFSHILVWL